MVSGGRSARRAACAVSAAPTRAVAAALASSRPASRTTSLGAAEDAVDEQLGPDCEDDRLDEPDAPWVERRLPRAWARRPPGPGREGEHLAEMSEGHAARPTDEQRDDVRCQASRRRVQPEEHPDPEDRRLGEEEHPGDDVRERSLEAVRPVLSPDPRRQARLKTAPRRCGGLRMRGTATERRWRRESRSAAPPLHDVSDAESAHTCSPEAGGRRFQRSPAGHVS